MRLFEPAWRVPVLVCGLAFLTACTSNEVSAERPGSGAGIDEYRELATKSGAAVKKALNRLEQVSAQSERCPPKVVEAFAQEVDRLQIDSIRVRARARAIQARGDAYFEAWTESPEIMARTQPGRPPDYMPKLRDSFEKTKFASRQVGDAFRAFFTGLRKVRAEVERDPSVVQREQAKELIRATREQGFEVLQTIGKLKEELRALRLALAPTKPLTKM